MGKWPACIGSGDLNSGPCAYMASDILALKMDFLGLYFVTQIVLQIKICVKLFISIFVLSSSSSQRDILLEVLIVFR